MRIVLVSDIHDQPETGGWPGGDLDVAFVRMSDAAGAAHLRGEALHRHLFSNGGMEKAVAHVAALGGDESVGIGFSAGGTALWRAAAGGMRMRALVCVSSTRLRLETSRLSIPVHTFWGGRDAHIPDETWRRTMPTSSHVYEGLEHGFYQKPEGDAAGRLWTAIRRALGHM